ncbi:kinase-like domain-containing protein, partial [Rhizophagus irregularis DAOM 181602=DAOM 197198]
MDDFILKNRLRWIPYNKFKNVEYFNEGGFGTIYRAIWLKNNGDKEVILKCPKNLNENLNEFLEEWEYHASVLASSDIIEFYGFTKNPNTSKYMVVMDYANKGNLRENLTTIVENNWKKKLYMLYEIISGLSNIHEKNLIHCDFHDGNILNHNNKNEDKIYISDLGLCQPVKSFLKKHDIYGVISFMAPEVLRGKSYTPASDMYSFSMIMWELTSGVSPFNDRAHDLQLSLSICKGERPEIIENTPQCYVNLMKKCWNEDPLNRPSASEVKVVIENWIYYPGSNKFSEELKSNIMEFINAPIGHNNLATKSHPKAYFTSRLLDFTSKDLNEILKSENSQAYRA